MARLDLCQGETPRVGNGTTIDLNLGHDVGDPAEDRLGAAVDPVEVQAVEAGGTLDRGGGRASGISGG